MNPRITVSIACLLVFTALSSLACPGDEKYCPEHDGCVAAAHNCSDGVILSCVNETAPCADQNGTRHCVDVYNYTCGNVSCKNTTRYCAKSESCIEDDKSCCTDHQEACDEVEERVSLFRRDGLVDRMCDKIVSSNFSDYYDEIKQNNLVENDRCDNGTYFCPLTLGCIATNTSCNSSRIGDSGSFDVFAKDCAKLNKSFCSIMMQCIPAEEICSYKKLFDWAENRNASIDLFGRACLQNETFCNLTFGCRGSCELEDVMGNRSCNGTPGTSLCPKTLQCGGLNGTRCNASSGEIDWTNVTDSTASGWQDFCKHREVISSALWKKALDCKPHAAKCEGDEKRKRSCEIHKLCPMLREGAKRYENQSMINETVLVGDCNVTINEKVLEICNISMNQSCGMHRLCHLLRNMTEGHHDDNSTMNRTIHVDECNITVNATFMHICNITLREKKNKSCKVHELCSELRHEIREHSVKINSTMFVEGCNITFNATTMHVCNITLQNKSCKVHELCSELRHEIREHLVKMNNTIFVEGCNITFNATTMHVCNITLPEKKNKSCKVHELCSELRHEIREHSVKINSTMFVEGCNITFNATTMHVCNITLQNKSCKVHEFCSELRHEIREHSVKINSTMFVEGCNITFNATTMHICNITLPEKKNKSCKVHELCSELRHEIREHLVKMNSTIFVEGCNITFNATTMHVCNITLQNKSCKVHELCSELRHEIREHLVKINSTMFVEGCNITFNATTMHVCNITLPEKKNNSCEIHKLCHHLRNMTKKDKHNSIVNRTVAVGGCNITVNRTVVHMCNISACDLDRLCPKLRNLTANHTKYSLPRGQVTIGHCNIKLNATAMEEECNISLPSDYKYKTFINGFKVSDSVRGRIAVYEFDVSRNIGIWEYKNGRAWLPLGNVSSSSAVVLEPSVYLRFITNDSFWHGLATLKYCVVQGGATGSHTDVTSFPEDPRNTLAMVQCPRTPVANVTDFIGQEYTVPEDETTAGFKIGDKFVLNMTHEVSYNIPGDELPFLHEGVVKNYNNTVRVLESLVPAIAIISTGSTREGNWQIGRRHLRTVRVTKPEVVTPFDSLRFVSARNKYGNWTMKFVAIVYSNISVEIPQAYFDAPDSIVYALQGVMTLKKTSRPSRHFVESVLEEMAAKGTSYSLANFNGVVDRLRGSSRNKTEAKDIAAMVFERVTLPPSSPRASLPRILRPHGKLAILNNPTASVFHVHVTRTNDQPITSASRLFIPAIGYNLTSSPNVGILVKDLITKAKDIDGDTLGIAVAQALNSSIGSWYYQAPNNQSWVQMIVDNEDYNTGQVDVVTLTSEFKIRFQMHDDDILWSNVEALRLAKLVFFVWDGSDGRSIGRRNITRPSDSTSAYSDGSVVAIVRRMGCDGKTGSQGKLDRCSKCGGDGLSCMGCDGTLNSGAAVDECGNCTGGTTNLTFNFMKDCADECGLSFNDSCGYCKRKGSRQKIADCAGTCFGRAKINDCGVCTGGASGKPRNYGKDLCGVCNGTNSTCTDCVGVPNGGKKWDMCDKCRLPRDPLFNNDCINLKFNLPESGSSTGAIAVDVKGAGLSRFTTVSCELSNQNTSARTASSSASFRTLNGARVIRLTTPSLAPGNYKIMCQFDGAVKKYTVENTTFLVYNKSAISFTSVSPDEVLVNSAVVAYVTGVGFVNTPDLACVTRNGLVFPATFHDATNVSCAIPGTRKSTRLQLAVSFSRAHRVVTESVNFTIVAEAPTPIAARFTNNLQAIRMTFDHPSVPQVKSMDCAMFFTTANVSKFGTKAKCKFRTPKTMLILLRGRPTIGPNNTIHFKTTSIKRKFQEVTETPTSQFQELSVGQPIKSVVPTAVITGTSFLGLCAALKLNGGRSYGSGGRRLKFTWFAEWRDPDDPQIDANATADLQNLTTYFGRINGGHIRKHKLELPYIVIGPQYLFKLSVENFLFQTSENVSLVVQRENKQLPGLSLGAETKTVKTSLGTTLQGKIKLSSCLPAGYNAKVLYLWEIKAFGVNLGVVDKSRLRIKKGTLIGGKLYTVTLTATMASDVNLMTTAKIVLDVSSSPLRPIIKGGSMKTVGEDEDTLVLDASRSSDPDGSSDVASYAWSCFDMNDFPCNEPDPNNVMKSRRMVLPSSPKITINVSSKLKTNTTYKFKMLFGKGSRKSEADILVKVEPGTPPNIAIQPPSSLKINPTEKLIITGFVKSKQTIVASWSCVEGEDEFSYIDLSDPGVLATRRTKRFVLAVKEPEVVGAMDLVIKKDQLQNAAQYKFRLTALGTYSDIIITTNAAPTQGTLTVDPITGFFGNTTFLLSAEEGWMDSDSPLSYQFGYHVMDEKTNEYQIELLTRSENTELETLLPPGDEAKNFSLSIFVVVYDIYGAWTMQQSKVIVRPVPIDAAAVTEFAKNVESSFESGDLASAAATANAVTRALAAAGDPSDASTTQALKDFKSAVTDMVLSSNEDGGVQDESMKDVVKGVLLQMTSGCKPNCDASRVAKNLAKMEGAGQSSSQSRRRRRAVQDVGLIQVKTGDQVETVLRIFDNVMEPRNYSNSSLVAKANFLSTIAAQEKSLCAGLATDGPPEIAKSNLTVIRTVKNSFINVDNDFLEVSTAAAPEFITATVTYRLGLTLKTVYDRWACTGDDTCTGMCIASAQFKDDLLILHDPSDKNLTRLSDIASVRLYNPQTLAEVSVSGLALPVVLRFPIENAESLENYTKECRVWNDGPKEWQLSGCTGYETVNTSIIECSCTQLGFITVFKGEKSVPTTAPPTTTPYATTKTPEKPEQAVKVQFAFAADFGATFTGNITSGIFKLSLKTLLSSLLNVSTWRIVNMTIRNGSIIVSFDILPSNTSNEANVTSSVAALKQLVSSNNINLTLPGFPQVLRVDPSSFKIISQTTVAPPTKDDDDDDDDDGWSTGLIVVVVVVCSLAFLAIVAAVLYYILKVRPANGRHGKVSPKTSRVQLAGQHSNEVPMVEGVNNNAVDVDEKSV